MKMGSEYDKAPRGNQTARGAVRGNKSIVETKSAYQDINRAQNNKS